mmetsp:Transcript_1019/g.2183  ORF Transcript_1019/g.2183 Transcript_1019/m.2183 type:complete len:968 (+) Transcript_1019:2-2905(+)
MEGPADSHIKDLKSSPPEDSPGGGGRGARAGSHSSARPAAETDSTPALLSAASFDTVTTSNRNPPSAAAPAPLLSSTLSFDSFVTSKEYPPSAGRILYSSSTGNSKNPEVRAIVQERLDRARRIAMMGPDVQARLDRAKHIAEMGPKDSALDDPPADSGEFDASSNYDLPPTLDGVLSEETRAILTKRMERKGRAGMSNTSESMPGIMEESQLDDSVVKEDAEESMHEEDEQGDDYYPYESHRADEHGGDNYPYESHQAENDASDKIDSTEDEQIFSADAQNSEETSPADTPGFVPSNYYPHKKPMYQRAGGGQVTMQGLSPATEEGEDAEEEEPDEENKVKMCNDCSSVVTKNMEYIHSEKERVRDKKTAYKKETMQNGATADRMASYSAARDKINSNPGATEETLIWNNVEAIGGQAEGNDAASDFDAVKKSEQKKSSQPDGENKILSDVLNKKVPLNKNIKNTTAFKYLNAQSRSKKSAPEGNGTRQNSVSNIITRLGNARSKDNRAPAENDRTHQNSASKIIAQYGPKASGRKKLSVNGIAAPLNARKGGPRKFDRSRIKNSANAGPPPSHGDTPDNEKAGPSQTSLSWDEAPGIGSEGEKIKPLQTSFSEDIEDVDADALLHAVALARRKFNEDEVGGTIAIDDINKIEEEYILRAVKRKEDEFNADHVVEKTVAKGYRNRDSLSVLTTSTGGGTDFDLKLKEEVISDDGDEDSIFSWLSKDGSVDVEICSINKEALESSANFDQASVVPMKEGGSPNQSRKWGAGARSPDEYTTPSLPTTEEQQSQDQTLNSQSQSRGNRPWFPKPGTDKTFGSQLPVACEFFTSAMQCGGKWQKKESPIQPYQSSTVNQWHKETQVKASNSDAGSQRREEDRAGAFNHDDMSDFSNGSAADKYQQDFSGAGGMPGNLHQTDPIGGESYPNYPHEYNDEKLGVQDDVVSLENSQRMNHAGKGSYPDYSYEF